MRNKEYDREYRERRYREEWKPAYDEFIKLYPFGLDDLPGERWAPIEGYDAYHVSTFGRVKSFNGRWGEVTILKPLLGMNGYLNVELYKGGKAKRFSVARLVALCFIPNPDNLPEVDHINGDKFDNRVENLRWVTRSENTKAAVDLGLKGSGIAHPQAKLTTAQVVFIRENPDGLTQEELADMFHCTPTTISYAQTGKTYTNESGTIREAKNQPLSDEAKALIRRLYVRGSKEFGSGALAKLFNCDPRTIRRIVNRS